jgi:hypothetical protein
MTLHISANNNIKHLQIPSDKVKYQQKDNTRANLSTPQKSSTISD